jgi:hypothetical protein
MRQSPCLQDAIINNVYLFQDAVIMFIYLFQDAVMIGFVVLSLSSMPVWTQPSYDIWDEVMWVKE